MKAVEKTWGREHWVVNNSRYCYKEMFIKNQHFCSMHYHKNKDETFILKSGEVWLTIDNVSVRMKINAPHRVKPGQVHAFKAYCDSLIFEISTHHEDSDSYRTNSSGRAGLP